MEIPLIDLGFALIITGAAVFGLLAGAIRTVGPFALLFALTATIHEYPDVASRLGKTPFTQLFLFLVGLLICGLVAKSLYAAVRVVGLHYMDKLFGAALGLISGCVIAALIVLWLKAYAGSETKSLLNSSLLAPSLLEFYDMVMALAQNLLPRATPNEPWWKRVWN